MAVAVATTSSLALGAGRTTSTIPAPASIANGDLLLAFLFIGDAGDQTAPTPTPPAGFTADAGNPYPLTHISDTGYGAALRVYWKIAASESGSYSFTHTSADTQGFMYRLTGTHTTTPLSPNPTSNAHPGAGTAGRTSVATGLTTPANDCLVIYAVALWDGAGGDPPTGTTPTFTERYDSGAMYMADGVLATAGATGNKQNATQWASQSTTSPWRALLLSVQPPAAGGGGGGKPVKVWSGSAWVTKPTKVWSGSAWVTKPAKVWNGSAWM